MRFTAQIQQLCPSEEHFILLCICTVSRNEFTDGMLRNVIFRKCNSGFMYLVHTCSSVCFLIHHNCYVSHLPFSVNVRHLLLSSCIIHPLFAAVRREAITRAPDCLGTQHMGSDTHPITQTGRARCHALCVILSLHTWTVLHSQIAGLY